MAKKTVEQQVKIPFDIMRRSKIWFAISLLIIIPGIFSMFTNGFNFGIDFTGGTIIDMRFEKEVTLPEIRDSLRKYNLTMQQFSFLVMLLTWRPPRML